MTKISVADVGYIAGLFDGEGSLHIRRGLEKKKKHKGKPGYRMSRDCYYVCRLLWPHAKVKLPKLEKVIDHYEPEYIMNEKVVSLHEYRQNMDME